MNVRKRGLALLMCICMIFTLLPFSAFADGEESYNTHSETGGVVMDKTVTHVSDDTYKVTLEQYVSGSVTPGTTTPIDAVLVLDVSGSMDEGFGEGDAAYVEEYNPEKKFKLYLLHQGCKWKLHWSKLVLQMQKNLPTAVRGSLVMLREKSTLP